jgi:ubiquinone/menaquinone biosynthesis C-methylase UbiE
MIGMLIPKSVKNYVHHEFRWLFKANLRSLMPELMQGANYFPYRQNAELYSFPKNGHPRSVAQAPVPPQELWVHYGRTPEEHLESGREDVARMREVLARAGVSLEDAPRILELGCAAGRMTRWLSDLAGTHEIWGADIWADAIMWCKQNLSPPLHFVTTTVAPHLPFEDRSFDFIYCGSVFTHIDDMADAWFLELRRLLHPGGHLYITILDQRVAKIFQGELTPEELEAYSKRAGGKERWHSFCAALRAHPEFDEFARSDLGMLTINRGVSSHVFYDVDYLHHKLAPFYRPVSVTEKAYGHQTVLLLERV